MPEPRRSNDGPARDADWARELERGRLRRETASRVSVPERTNAGNAATGNATAARGGNRGATTLRTGPGAVTGAPLPPLGGAATAPGTAPTERNARTARPDVTGRRAPATGGRGGRNANGSPRALRISSELRQRFPAGSSGTAAEREAAIAFKRTVIRPLFAAFPTAILMCEPITATSSLLSLVIYGFLASTGRRGTIKYNVVERLLVLLYATSYAGLILLALTSIVFIASMLMCTLDVACIAQTVLDF